MGFDFKRNPDELLASHQINVTPFIDVMLVLLVIFMVTAPLSMVRVPLELPSSTAQPTSPAPSPIVLSVQQDLQLSLGNTPVARSALGAALDQRTQDDRSTRVYVRADQAIRYGDLMAVMDLLRGAGYVKIALLGRESGPESAASAGAGGGGPASAGAGAPTATGAR